MHTRKNFIPKNEGFTCENCSQKVPPAAGTFRNHCPHCLTGKHVDTIPGDRANPCGGLMPTIGYEGSDPDRLMLVQQCQNCGAISRNRVAPDDNRDLITSMPSRPL